MIMLLIKTTLLPALELKMPELQATLWQEKKMTHAVVAPVTRYFGCTHREDWQEHIVLMELLAERDS